MRLVVTNQIDQNDGKLKKIYTFTKIREFDPVEIFDKDTIEEVFNFAYGMSFGNKGHHRNHRTGGINRRKNGEIFSDTFQGKLAEYALWKFFIKNNITLPSPDVEMYEKGLWDNSDFNLNGVKIAVKSTKSFGHLLLLEAEDWNNEGLYIPNLHTEDALYHYFVLIRLSSPIAEIMKKNKYYYANEVNYDKLKKIVLHNDFSYDIPGFMTNNTLIHLIKNHYFIPQGAYLNILSDKNIMDADNYYIQSGDLADINELIQRLQNI